MSSPDLLNVNLIFLKLGGSLITDKTQPRVPRRRVIRRLAGEIAAARRQRPDLHVLLGHGSGSFGHTPARKYATRQGVAGPHGWQGFVEVWREAAALNHLVMQALEGAAEPALAFSPSAAVTAREGRVIEWNLVPIQAALTAGLTPVVYGDVAFDTRRGGTILSTEDLFAYLAARLKPARVLLAGLEPGVWADYPTCQQLMPTITPDELPGLSAALGSAAGTDVTGGMDSKVRQSLAMAEEIPGLEVRIFSGAQPGLVEQALLGAQVGTALTAGLPPGQGVQQREDR